MRFNSKNLRENLTLETDSFEPPEIFRILTILKLLNEEEFEVVSFDGKVKAVWCFAYLNKCNYEIKCN